MAGRRSFALVIRRSEVESFIRDVCRAAEKFMELFRDELFFFFIIIAHTRRAQSNVDTRYRGDYRYT